MSILGIMCDPLGIVHIDQTSNKKANIQKNINKIISCSNETSNALKKIHYVIRKEMQLWHSACYIYNKSQCETVKERKSWINISTLLEK